MSHDPDVCRWCGGPAFEPRLNSRDEPCPCGCHPRCPVAGCTMDLHFSRAAHDADVAAGEGGGT